MIIPYEVDVYFDRRPWTNYLIIAIAILVFIAQYRPMQVFDDQVEQETHKVLADANDDSKLTAKAVHHAYLQAFRNVKNPLKNYMLWDYSASSLFGYMWLHADIFHIIGNLIFLWVFGNAVCSKIGNFTYGPVYVLLGVIAGIGGVIFKEIPGLGASGAINAIVGMYLVLFPKNEISCFYIWGFRPGTFSCSSYWMVLYWLAFDIFGFVIGSGGVGYAVHLTGFAAGIGVAVGLLMTKWVVMDEGDEHSLLEVFRIQKKAEVLFDRTGKRIKTQPRVNQYPDAETSKQIPVSEFSLETSASAASARQESTQSLSAEDFMASASLPPISFDWGDIAAQDKPAPQQPQKIAAAAAAQPVSDKRPASIAASKTSTVNISPQQPAPQSEVIRFSCACGHKFKVPKAQAGKAGRCPHCKAVIRIPQSSTA